MVSDQRQETQSRPTMAKITDNSSLWLLLLLSLLCIDLWLVVSVRAVLPTCTCV